MALQQKAKDRFGPLELGTAGVLLREPLWISKQQAGWTIASHVQRSLMVTNDHTHALNTTRVLTGRQWLSCRLPGPAWFHKVEVSLKPERLPNQNSKWLRHLSDFGKVSCL